MLYVYMCSLQLDYNILKYRNHVFYFILISTHLLYFSPFEIHPSYFSIPSHYYRNYY